MIMPLTISTLRKCRGSSARLSLFAALVTGFISIGFVSTALADPPADVQPASLTQPLTQSALGDLGGGKGLSGVDRTIASHSVPFAQLPTRVGDRVGQEVQVELNLHATIIQSGQVANQSRQVIHRRQDRGIEVLEVARGRVHRAHVTYLTCRQLRREAPPDQDPTEDQAISQPIEGKSYFVTRQGKQLLVTDQDGNIPPWDEYQIVAENMQTLGQPNPLAQFLLGRTFRTGERIVLPQSLAEQLLGLNEPFGKVQSFELEFMGSDTIAGQPCALFNATIAAQAREQGEIGLNITGRLVIQTATCRTVTAELAGPVQMAAEEKTRHGSFQYRATGDMHLSIHSTYASGAP